MNKILLTLVVFVLSLTVSKAQCDSLIQGLTDSMMSADGWVLIPGEGDPEDAVSVEDLTASYIFHYSSDSSRLLFEFAEFLKNRRKLMLKNWCDDRVVNWDAVNEVPIADWSAQELRDRSRTHAFLVSPGDTLQYYREYSWIDRLTEDVTWNRYVNDHEIAYSVELVNASNGARIMVMDTLVIGTTTMSKKPCIQGWYPPLSRVRGFVPSSVSNNTSVYLRVNMYDLHGSPRPFVRVDNLHFMRSYAHLGTSTWTYYNDSVRTNISCGMGNTCGVIGVPQTSPAGIYVSSVPYTTLDRVRIYDIYGAHLWTSTIPLGTNPSFVTTGSGLFIVVGEENGSVVCTRNVYVP